MTKEAKLWGGRFCQTTDQNLAALNSSLSVDRRLFSEDIDGSQAYAQILGKAGILTSFEVKQIHDGLERVRKEWLDETIELQESDEDVHSVNERRLIELIGAVGGKLHTGRSRNDQVIVDMKLWLKKSLECLVESLKSLILAMVKRSDDNIEILFPGYTHLQRAQPVRFSHWLLSHAFALLADIRRFEDFYRRMDSLPLGSGALAGNPFNIDRPQLAKLLGFANVTENSMQAIGDRDFVAEFLSGASLSAIHLSRLAEDLIIYSTKEFNFVQISDAFSTGSSLMPQKRNPDSLELIRGVAGEVFGRQCGFFMTLKGLPTTYNKDLQSDKETMFFAFDKLQMALTVMQGVIETMAVDRVSCKAALSFDMLATDLAYYLVRKGVPFRTAHHISGQVVALTEQKRCKLNEVALVDLQVISLHFDEDYFSIWDYEQSVEQYQAVGGTARASVHQQIKSLTQQIAAINLKKHC